MLGPGGLDKVLRGAVFLVLGLVVIVAPLIGCFAFSPLVVAWGIQPYPLAAALSVMAAEALCILGLIVLVRKSR
ncbi:MAG: hypothetical protein QM773_17385 [Hyphomonadaceae bacterium]